MEAEKRRALRDLARLLGGQNVKWALGASALLVLHGIVDHCNDFDLMVAPGDIKAVDELLGETGVCAARPRREPFLTEHFYEYRFQNVDIDVMVGFAVRLSDGRAFRYDFDRDAIAGYMDFEGAQVPLMHLEDWYALYGAMPGREHRTRAIYQYLSTHGVARPERLRRALSQPLPPEIVAGARALLGEAPI